MSRAVQGEKKLGDNDQEEFEPVTKDGTRPNPTHGGGGAATKKLGDQKVSLPLRFFLVWAFDTFQSAEEEEAFLPLSEAPHLISINSSPHPESNI